MSRLHCAHCVTFSAATGRHFPRVQCSTVQYSAAQYSTSSVQYQAAGYVAREADHGLEVDVLHRRGTLLALTASYR